MVSALTQPVDAREARIFPMSKINLFRPTTHTTKIFKSDTLSGMIVEMPRSLVDLFNASNARTMNIYRRDKVYGYLLHTYLQTQEESKPGPDVTRTI
jgi:hypothetical protein